MSTGRFLSVLVLGCTLAACSSTMLKIPGEPIQANEQSLGQVHGGATGIMLFQFIPIGQNTRFERAYAQALNSKPGATRLTDVVIHEHWFWAWLLNGYGFEVEATAVGPR
jgi:hypothetical protein